MNSDEERELLESYGWKHDVVRRMWIAPDGAELDTDTLVAAAATMGRKAMDDRLREIAKEHGKR